MLKRMLLDVRRIREKTDALGRCDFLCNYFLLGYKNTKTTCKKVMSNLTLPITGLVLLSGYLLKKESEKYTNIYSSNTVSENREKLLDMGIKNVIDARNPTFTGVYNPLLNAVGRPIDKETSNRTTKDLTREYNEQRIGPKVTPPVTKQLKQLRSMQDDEYYTFNPNAPVKPFIADDTHSNMIPFFKGHAHETNVEDFSNQRELYNATGTEPLYNTKKEVGSFYDGGKEDIYKLDYVSKLEIDRYIPSRFKQGEKLFEDVRVAKPIENTIDNTAVPRFKDIDELRVNKKNTYSGRTVNGINATETQRGILAVPSKNAPETYYAQTSEHLFKGPGAIKAHEMDNVYDVRYTPKQDSIEYSGHAGTSDPAQMSRDFEFRESFKQEHKLIPGEYAVANGIEKPSDYGANNTRAYTTQRESTNKPHITNVNKAHINLKIHPEDLPKVTLKELMGKVSTTETGHVNGGYVKNDGELFDSPEYDYTLKPTTKENTVDYTGNGHKAANMGYLVNKFDNKITFRELMENMEYKGSVQNMSVPLGATEVGETRMRNTRNVERINPADTLRAHVDIENYGKVTRKRLDSKPINTISGDRFAPEFAQTQILDNPYAIRLV
jgi:hypothetical protein